MADWLGGRDSRHVIRAVGLPLGPLLLIAVLLIPIPDLTFAARGVLGLALWMGAWWLTEAIPIYATALLPLVIFPALAAPELRDAPRNYAADVVFLFLGGFLLARGVERVRLDRRFALAVLGIFGASPRRLVAGFMFVTAALSAWISNTATAVLMLPIALAVIADVGDPAQRRRFGACLMLCIAYSASLGGMATLIGTPPNAILASLARDLAGVDVSFARWMLVGVPLSLVSLAVVWWYMVNLGMPIGHVALPARGDRIPAAGGLSRDEALVAAVMGLAVLAWLTRGLIWGGLLPAVSDATVAVTAALLLFILPARSGGRLLDWKTAVGLPWGVLLLVGGGLTLAAGFANTGLDVWVANRLVFLDGLPHAVVVMAVVGITIMASEIMSNTATAALVIPIVASLGETLGISPMLLMLPVAFATSFCFTLPVATPPNAIVFGSGYLTVGRMARAGFPLDLVGIAIVTTAALVLAPLVWG